MEGVIRRDVHEKKAFSMIFDDFDKYNKEIQKIANKNNELLVMNSVAKVLNS